MVSLCTVTRARRQPLHYGDACIQMCHSNTLISGTEPYEGFKLNKKPRWVPGGICRASRFLLELSLVPPPLGESLGPLQMAQQASRLIPQSSPAGLFGGDIWGHATSAQSSTAASALPWDEELSFSLTGKYSMSPSRSSHRRAKAAHFGKATKEVSSKSPYDPLLELSYPGAIGRQVLSVSRSSTSVREGAEMETSPSPLTSMFLTLDAEAVCKQGRSATSTPSLHSKACGNDRGWSRSVPVL